MNKTKNLIDISGYPVATVLKQSLFDLLFDDDGTSDDTPQAVPCRIYNWRRGASLRFMDLKRNGYDRLR